MLHTPAIGARAPRLMWKYLMKGDARRRHDRCRYGGFGMPRCVAAQLCRLSARISASKAREMRVRDGLGLGHAEIVWFIRIENRKPLPLEFSP
jgi:hypothetical protein